MDVRTLCLGALMAGEATGYEIRKMFEDGTFSHFQIASLGSIYPALTKLTQDGLVTFVEREQENRPDKKIYRLTAEGRRHFLRGLIQARPGADRYRSDILFMLTFAEDLPIELTEALVDEFARRHEIMHGQIDMHRNGTPDGGSDAETCGPDANRADDADGTDGTPSPCLAMNATDANGVPLPGHRFVAGLGRAMCEATIEFIRQNKAGLIDDLKQYKNRKNEPGK